MERSLHFAFGDHHINPNREFFKIEAERMIAVLKLLKVEDITAQLEQTLEADVTAADTHSVSNIMDARTLYAVVHGGGERGHPIHLHRSVQNCYPVNICG